MKTTKQSQHHEIETSWYHDFFYSTKQFLAQGEMTELLDSDINEYGMFSSCPITEKNARNACIVLIHWIYYMQKHCVTKLCRKYYFGLFEECHDISKDNSKLPIYPSYIKEARSMAKEKEMAAIDSIVKYMYEVDERELLHDEPYESLVPTLKESIDGHSLHEIYEELTKYANAVSNLLYDIICSPREDFLIALGTEAYSSLDFLPNSPFPQILACKPNWKEMIESKGNDDYHKVKLGRLVWERRSTYHYGYLKEIAICYWTYVCNIEEMRQLDDSFGYKAEEKEVGKTVASKQDMKKFERARNIWEVFVNKGYLEREGRMYRWVKDNKSQFGYFIYYAHKYLHKQGTLEENIRWGVCCKFFTMPQSGTKTYRNACSTIRTFEKNKRNKSKASQQLPREAQEISKIFKYLK